MELCEPFLREETQTYWSNVEWSGTAGEVDKISLGSDAEHGIGVILAENCNFGFLWGSFGGRSAGHHAPGEGRRGMNGPEPKVFCRAILDNILLTILFFILN